MYKFPRSYKNKPTLLSSRKLIVVSKALLVLDGLGIDLIGVIWTGARYGELFGADPIGPEIGFVDGVLSWTLQTAPTYRPLRKLQTGNAT